MEEPERWRLSRQSVLKKGWWRLIFYARWKGAVRVEKSVFVALKVYLQFTSSPGSLNYFSSPSTPCSSSSSSPSHPRHRHHCHRPSLKRPLPPFVLSTFCSSQPFKKTSSTLQKTSSTLRRHCFQKQPCKNCLFSFLLLFCFFKNFSSAPLPHSAPESLSVLHSRITNYLRF